MDAQVDLNDAALLVRVVQTHSFSAAARERGVPVSTVSRRIARLEGALGTRLLERTTRRLQLTDAGRAYFAHAERALDDLAQGTSRVREIQTEPHGRVRMTAPIALGAAVSGVASSYLARYPHVSLDLELTERRIDPLDDGIDLAVVTGTPDTTEVVARQLWQSTRKLLYASPHYLAERGAPRRLEDLARHDCVATRATEAIATWTLVGPRGRRRLSFAPRFCVNEFSAALRAVVAGVGIGMLPEVLCTGEIARRRLVRVLESHEGELGGVSLLYRAHRSLTAAVRTCIDHFVAELPGSDPALLTSRAGPLRRARRPAAAAAR